MQVLYKKDEKYLTLSKYMIPFLNILDKTLCLC